MEKQPQGRKKRKQWPETSRTPNLDSRVPLHYGVVLVIRCTTPSFSELCWLKASCSPFEIQIESLCSFTSRERTFSYIYGFPTVSDSKEYACNAGDLGSIPGLGRSPGGRQGHPLQCSCLENPHGQRSLAGYSPWGHRESDTTERLSTAHTHACAYIYLNMYKYYI